MEGKNVVMLVYNYFENDSRVLKEAATLSQVGYTISIFTLWKKGLDKVEKIDENTTVYRQEFLPFHKLVLGENIFEFLKKKIYKKVVPKKTPNSQVNQSIKRDTSQGSSYNYNYSWHIGLKEYNDYMAIGLYKQHIYVYPKKKIIIVLLNDRENKLKAERINWWFIFRQLVDQL